MLQGSKRRWKWRLRFFFFFNLKRKKKKKERKGFKANKSSENVSRLPFGYVSKFLRKNKVGLGYTGGIIIPILQILKLTEGFVKSAVQILLSPLYR